MKKIMEIYFNNQLIGFASKSKSNFSLEKIEITDSSKILESQTNELKINNNIFRINMLVDGLDTMKKLLNEDEFMFNSDMYENIPLKYSFIKKNNNIYLYSIELS